ncbi:hypothetical protein [Ralstonia solanacearum]|uniref:hypothetical protein n=1 Tax=Ralstonia solanacearum TaxID=305 RepID=UPI001E30A1C4|nr:hypothetical protein [Ralstonia solanacearum]
MTTVTLAEYARRVGKSRAAVTQWKNAGKLVMQGERVDVEATDAKLKRYRRDGLPDIETAPKAVKRGRPSVKQPVRLTCDEVARRLAALDWTQTFDWSTEAQDERARQAVQCIGWEAVTSPLRDDGHFGGYQLRIPESVAKYGLTVDTVPAGHGFELDTWDVLKVCRAELEPIDDDQEVIVRLDLLHLLAYPFGECQRKD